MGSSQRSEAKSQRAKWRRDEGIAEAVSKVLAGDVNAVAGAGRSQKAEVQSPNNDVRCTNNESRGRTSIVADAIARVLEGDVEAYAVIYRACDGALRAFTSRRYGHKGDDFVNEVAIRTHEFCFNHLSDYNRDKGAAFQTWVNECSLDVAGQVLVEWDGLRRLGPRGPERRRVAVLQSFDEEKHAAYANSVPGPAEEYEAKMRSRLLWQEYDRLAREGRLSIALYDLGDRTLAETAEELGMPVIRLRRLLERNHHRLRKRLKRHGVRPAEPEPHYGRVWSEPDDTGYDDDWSATSMAYLPDDPDTLVGAAAKSEKEES